jgi:hypothetical protein
MFEKQRFVSPEPSNDGEERKYVQVRNTVVASAAAKIKEMSFDTCPQNPGGYLLEEQNSPTMEQVHLLCSTEGPYTGAYSTIRHMGLPVVDDAGMWGVSMIDSNIASL